MGVDKLIQLILEGLEAEREAYRVFERTLKMPTITEAYEKYAERFGRPPLTKEEKRQAYISAILKGSN